MARGVKVAPGPEELARRIDELVARRAAEEFPPPPLKDAIRNLLRRGGFRPAGRNKPSSEYLAQAAREGRFPRINNLVDINNVLSLEWGLPISLLDLDALGEQMEIRCGLEGEKYVFNAGGQEIDLAGLICVCRADAGASTPLGNPIKDSMAGKIKDQTTAVAAFIYATAEAVDEPAMAKHAAEFAELLQRFAQAQQTEVRVVRGAA